MRGGKHMRTSLAGGLAVLAVWGIVALTAPAQYNEPNLLPFVSQPLPNTYANTEGIEPAQFQDRGLGRTPPGVPIRSATNVPDPPHPVVSIRVRVPADAMPGEDLKYVIAVQNLSTADAHRVYVRNPLSPGVAVVKSEPEYDKNSNAEQLIWSLGTLKAGASRSIELTLRPKQGIAEIKNLAYVQFEHGQAVTTKIGNPTVKITKNAPKQVVRDETFTVRVFVENTGKVTAEDVSVLENLPASAEVEAITTGAKRVLQAEGQQWMWTIPKLLPGERKIIDYRVTPREAKDLFTLTSIRGQKFIPDKPAEARTQVLVPGLEVRLAGPTGVVNPGESARYEVVVRNVGTLPSTNIRVTGTIPADCTPTMKTDGGQIYRDSIVWVCPRLEPGESQSYRFAVKANTTGRRVVVASAVDARGTRNSQELATTFSGIASLSWDAKFDPVTVAVGRQGVLTLKVKNTGGEVARNVRVKIDIPDNVSVVQTTPQVQVQNNVVFFPVEEIAGYGEKTYTLTFEGKKADQAWFKMAMIADCLGEKPMQNQRMVEVIGSPK